MAGIQQQHLEEIKGLLARDYLTREQAERLCRIGGLGGELPAPSGEHDGVEFWKKEHFQQWAKTEARQFRHVGGAMLSAVRGAMQPRSWNDDERSFTTVIATETPVRMYDFWGESLVDEILIAEGATVPDSFPVLVDHDRAVASTVGVATSPRREGAQWAALIRLGSDPLALEVADKVKAGILTAVSIGYRVEEFTLVRPGEAKMIGGRSFRNDGEYALRVSTKWKVFEVSIVSLPADANAKIRSADSHTRNQHMPSTLPAIHSRDSLTHRPSVGALTSAVLLRAGVNDPTRHRAVRERGVGSARRLSSSSLLDSEAEIGMRYAHESPAELVRRAAELDGLRFNDPRAVGCIFGVLHAAVQRSSVSLANLEGFLDSSFLSLMLTGYDDQGDSTIGWCAESDLRSIKREERAQLSAVELKRMPRGSAAEAVALAGHVDGAKLTGFGGSIVLDEQDLLHGGFGFLDEGVPQQLGAAARALRPNCVYAYLARNEATFDGVSIFHANHGNLLTGSALAEPTLTAACAAMGKQVEGVAKLNLRAEHVIVPQALERTAAKLSRDVESSAFIPAVVHSDSRLDNGLTDPLTGSPVAGSASTWYVSASEKRTVEVQYLEGTNRLPTMQSWFLKQGQFGRGFAVRHFIGVKAFNWEGIVKCVA